MSFISSRRGLSHERLLECLKYFPDSGKFIWLLDRPRARKGAEAGYLTKNGYRQIAIDGHAFSAHRLAFFYMNGDWPDLPIDHINGDGRDNAWSNLRQASFHQNSANRKIHKNNTSGYKGVSWDKKSKRWIAHIRVRGKGINLGSFILIEDAASTYEVAAKYYFGCFARMK